MAHHLPPTGSSWAIQDTANKGVTFARGMLEAATSDNINPVALICCESFGSLLPLCLETRAKMEILARRSHSSHVLNFVKAQIGYKKGDSVEQLSRSDSGVRFLCLAATLCTLDHYDAADRLDSLLQATQKDHQMRPTVRQLQVMMNTLRTKLILSDYANLVASCEIFCRSALADHGTGFGIQVAQVPPKRSLEALILALNEIGRLGEISSTELKLEPKYVPWTWAFIQWFLGVSPNVRTSAGKIVLAQKESVVTLTIIPQTTTSNPRKRRIGATNEGLQVSVRHDIHNLKEILFHENEDSKKWAWQGLVTVETWLRYQFAILTDRFPEIHSNQRLKLAIGQALFFTVGRLPERLILCDDYKSLRSGMSKLDGNLADLFHETTPKPFINSTDRLKIAQDLLREHIDLVHEEIETTGALTPANLALILKGSCRQCASSPNRLMGGTLPCRVNELLDIIGSIGSALLIFTLFGPIPDSYPMVMAGLAFDTSPFHHRLTPVKTVDAITSNNWFKLITTGWQPLMHGKCAILSCSAISIFKHAAKLMGHQKIRDSTIVSSKSGQVLYPSFFEATDFMTEGFMQLCAFPGKLNKDGMNFDFFLDAWSDTVHTEGLSDADTEEMDSSDENEFQILEDNDADPSPSDSGREASERQEQTVDRGADSEEAETGVSALEQVDQEDETSESRTDNIMDASESQPANDNNMVPRSFSTKKRPSLHQVDVMMWKVSVQDDLLRGELYLENRETPVMAWSVLESLSRCRITPPCLHRREAPAGEIGDQFLLSKGPATLHSPEEPRILFDVGGRYADQLAGLEVQDYYPATVIHVYGCIGCALKICLEGGSRTVIC